MNKYIIHLVKIIYILIFSSAVWFISFTIFPENQVIKLEVGEESPTSFSAPRYLSVVDENATKSLIDKAVSNVPPVYSIDSSISTDVIDGITEMFITVIKSRTEETLEQNEDKELEQSDPTVVIIELTKTEQIQKIRSSVLFSTISTSAIEVLVEISNTDKNNNTNYLTQIEFEAKNKANEFLSKGIGNENLNQQRQSIVSNPTTLNLSSQLYAIVPEARISSTVAEIIAENLIANQKLEEELWNDQKDKVAESIENVTVQFFKDELIVNEGDPISAVQFQALNELGFLSGESRTVQTAAIPIIFSVFLVLYILLWRLRDTIWANDNELLLMLTLILISSIFLRGVSYFSQLSDLEFIQYSLPISFVGILSVTLLNLRATLILSLSSSLLALAGGGSVGLVALGALGTIIPAIFLSEETDRLLLRERIVYISLTQPLLAFGVYFFLRDDGNLTQILIFSFLSALLANLAAFALISYIESIFRLTSGFKLSELADRNHPALRYLEDNALGTFNHSLVVGTLTDRAANKIGANSQLARAMAYYHDLSKTMNPTMFVENQIGSTNPHDTLSPTESANIIKSHVVDGIKLAKKFKIPEIVYQGILEHHGDAVLRFFYEKISDGQLNNAPITFNELEIIRESFQISLEGLYHQRVLYPEITEEE